MRGRAVTAAAGTIGTVFVTMLVAAEPEPRVERAVSSGLAFLARHQQEDGSIHDGGPRVATTGLALLAYLSAGHTQDLGRYGMQVRRAVDYLVKATPSDGYLGRADGSRMYGQGIATLALAEAYGVEPDPAQRVKIRAAVQRAVTLILRAQDVEKPEPHAGGWRYEPQSADSDLSLCGWNVLALRAARNIGIDVPQANFDRAAAYIAMCHRADPGGFAYQPRGEVSPAMNGVGIVTMCLLLDSYTDRAEVASAAKLLVDRPVNDQTRFFYYATYYSVHAALLVGGDVWDAVWTASRDRLLARQEKDGSWPVSPSAEEPGRVYATGMAVLTLNAPMRVLPGNQR